MCVYCQAAQSRRARQNANPAPANQPESRQPRFNPNYSPYPTEPEVPSTAGALAARLVVSAVIGLVTTAALLLSYRILT